MTPTLKDYAAATARVGLDAFLRSGAVLDFTPAGPPRVGVLVLLMDLTGVTLACLRSLALGFNRTPFELVLIGNGSTDETPALLGRLRGVHESLTSAANPRQPDVLAHNHKRFVARHADGLAAQPVRDPAAAVVRAVEAVDGMVTVAWPGDPGGPADLPRTAEVVPIPAAAARVRHLAGRSGHYRLALCEADPDPATAAALARAGVAWAVRDGRGFRPAGGEGLMARPDPRVGPPG